MNRQTATQTHQQKLTVTPTASGLLQRKCACGNHTMAGGECEECGKKKQTLQRAALSPRGRGTEGEGEVPPIVHEVLRSPGQPLDPATRAFMQPRFGHDFSQIRVHTDARASTSAETVHARAYTVGRDIIFAAGTYAPGTVVTINQPGDVYEQEAERVAAAVVGAGNRPLVRGGAALLQRQGEAGAGATAPPIVYEALHSPGQPLASATRAFMEPRFGHDFSRVRVHTDAKAAESARAVNALAYTVGRDVVFGAGQYAPGTRVGQGLLAHELTHVVQQTNLPNQDLPAIIMRKPCGHDGQNTSCGYYDALGKIKFTGDKDLIAIDRQIVKSGLPDMSPGKWLHEVSAPPRTEDKERGRIDALKVDISSGKLESEIIEIKARQDKITGGCDVATSQAKEYLNGLNNIRDKIQTLSLAISKIGGFRIMEGHTPKTGEEKRIFKVISEQVGADIVEDKDWKNAWAFYNSLQNKIPTVFKAPFSSVSFKLNEDGDTERKYKALIWLVECRQRRGQKRSRRGVGRLIFMVNKEGGLSYGCDSTCMEDVDDPDAEAAMEKALKEQDERQKAAQQPVKAQIVALHPDFGSVYRWPTNLPVIPLGRTLIICTTEQLFNGVAGSRNIERFKGLMQVRLPIPLSQRILTTIAILVAQVTGLAGGAVVAAGVVAGGAAGAGAAGVGAAGIAAGTTPTEATLVPVLLRSIAANDNARTLAKAAAAAMFTAILGQSEDANAEEKAESIVRQALSNPQLLAVEDITSQPGLARLGARLTIAENSYVVIAIARS